MTLQVNVRLYVCATNVQEPLFNTCEVTVHVPLDPVKVKASGAAAGPQNKGIVEVRPCDTVETAPTCCK